MTNNTMIEKIQYYFALVKPLYAVNRGAEPRGNIIQVLTQPSACSDGIWMEMKVVVQTNSRSVTYPTTDPRDEGWRMETGTFYEEQTIKFPLFVLDDSLSDDDMVNKLYRIDQTSKIADIRKSIAYQTRLLDEKKQELNDTLYITKFTASIGEGGKFKIIKNSDD